MAAMYVVRRRDEDWDRRDRPLHNTAERVRIEFGIRTTAQGQNPTMAREEYKQANQNVQ
jgi:hypothetical protein